MDGPGGQENIMPSVKDLKGVGGSGDLYKGNKKFGVIETRTVENFYSCVLLRRLILSFLRLS